MMVMMMRKMIRTEGRLLEQTLRTVSSYSIFTTPGAQYHCHHLIDEEIEAQKSQITAAKSHHCEGENQRRSAGLAGGKALTPAAFVRSRLPGWVSGSSTALGSRAGTGQVTGLRRVQGLLEVTNP